MARRMGALCRGSGDGYDLMWTPDYQSETDEELAGRL